MASKSPLHEILYRVSVHGTLADDALPFFHTPNADRKISGKRVETCPRTHKAVDLSTVPPYTEPPVRESRDYCDAIHSTTGKPYTKGRPNTVTRYTVHSGKAAVSFRLLARNCTKPSCTKSKTERTSHWMGGEGE